MRKLWRWMLGYASEPPAAPTAHVQAAPARLPDQADAAAPIAVPSVSPDHLEQRFLRYVLGLPDHHATTPGAQEQTLRRKLEASSSRFDVRSLPRLPTVLPQLLRSLKTESVGGAQLAQLIGRDPVLVGEVMRVSRSIYYRTLHPIQSLQHAVVLLGQDGLRRVVTLHVMKPILHASAGMFGHLAGQRLWEHAERCAHACAFLAKGQADPFEAYLAGIVCNTGTGAVVRLLDNLAPSELGPLSGDFLAFCNGAAAQLSLKAARHWSLPANVLQALSERAEATKSPGTLGASLRGADHLAMAQVLGEHGLLAADTDLGPCWPDRISQALRHRCQDDLARHFGAGAQAVD